jgi:uncharacterized protein
MNEGYMVKMNEDFGPVPGYRPYLFILVTSVLLLIWAGCLGWTFIYLVDPSMPAIAAYASVAVLVVMLVLGMIWSKLYFITVQYHMNETEITWKRGVLFHSTGIVPYNRMTDVNIVQGPLMRRFGISHLNIQTAGATANKSSVITIEGMNRAEELRGIIIDHMRGAAAGGATVGVVEDETSATDMSALVAEVREIRRLLEEKR